MLCDETELLIFTRQKFEKKNISRGPMAREKEELFEKSLLGIVM